MYLLSGMTYSADYRRLAFIKFQKTGKLRATARLLEISPSTIHRWKNSAHWGNTTHRTKRRLSARKLTEQMCSDLRMYYGVEAHCGHSIRTARLALSWSVSDSSMRRCLKKAGLSRKRLSTKILGSVSIDAVNAFKERYMAIATPGALVVSLDESAFSEKCQPLYGYSPVGQRCPLRQRQGSWTHWSLLLGITSDGRVVDMVKKGSVKRDDFASFILKQTFPRGTVFLLDNCSTHKGLDAVFQSKGYIPLFLSPYSPQFQPVELAFSKVKHHFRSCWPWSGDLRTVIDQSVRTLTPNDIAGYFLHATQEIAK